MARNYPDWLRGYLEYSASSEAPQKFHLWTGISVLAGALRRRVWIDQKYFQWLPNFYIIFVAPPGIISKSTTASIGMNLLREVPEIHFGPQAITRQALITSMAEATTLVEIATGTFQPMSAVTFSVSELGTMLDPKDRELLDILTGLWDGQIGAFDKVTKTQGSDVVENPWLNILACTTPRWLQDNLGEGVMGGGLASRVIWIYGEEKRHLAAYVDEAIPADFDKRKQLLIEDLTHIAEKLVGPFTLTSQARSWGRAWYEEHYKKALAAGFDDSLSGYVARKQTHLHKLAMILSVSQSDSLVIDVPILQRAENALNLAEKEMHVVFDAIRHTPVTRLAEQLVRLLHKVGKPVLQADVISSMFRTVDHETFQKVIATATMSGRIKVLASTDGKVILAPVETRPQKTEQRPALPGHNAPASEAPPSSAAGSAASPDENE